MKYASGGGWEREEEEIIDQMPNTTTIENKQFKIKKETRKDQEQTMWRGRTEK